MTLIFKLSTNEIIIGNVTENSDLSFIVTYPALLGQNGLEPYMGFGMGTITIYTSNIVATTIANPDIQKAYNDMFGLNPTVDLGCTRT
jgi:hypothetical protein